MHPYVSEALINAQLADIHQRAAARRTAREARLTARQARLTARQARQATPPRPGGDRNGLRRTARGVSAAG